MTNTIDSFGDWTSYDIERLENLCPDTAEHIFPII